MALAIGSGGHSALEYNAKQKIKTASDLAMEDLLDVTSDFIDTEIREVEDKTTSKGGHTKDTAIAAIRIFRERDAEKITPAGSEVRFDLDINDPDKPEEEQIRPILGYIDTIETNTDVFDYKFPKQRRSQTEVNITPQITLYNKVYHTLTGRYPRYSGYRMFLPGNKTTPPDAEVIYRDDILMTPEAQEARFKRLKNQFQMVERGIRAEIFPATDNPITCAYCPYRTRCQSSLVNDFEAAVIKGEN